MCTSNCACMCGCSCGCICTCPCVCICLCPCGCVCFPFSVVPSVRLLSYCLSVLSIFLFFSASFLSSFPSSSPYFSVSSPPLLHFLPCAFALLQLLGRPSSSTRTPLALKLRRVLGRLRSRESVRCNLARVGAGTTSRSGWLRELALASIERCCPRIAGRSCDRLDVQENVVFSIRASQ